MLDALYKNQGKQRVAARIQKVLIYADRVAENILPDSSKFRFNIIARRKDL